MLELTPNAKRYLANLRREHGVDDRAGARLFTKGGQVGLTFAPAPVSGHRVFDGEVIKVYVPPEIVETLGDSIIDAREENGETKLVMRKRATRTTDAAKLD